MYWCILTSRSRQLEKVGKVWKVQIVCLCVHIEKSEILLLQIAAQYAAKMRTTMQLHSGRLQQQALCCPLPLREQLHADPQQQHLTSKKCSDFTTKNWLNFVLGTLVMKNGLAQMRILRRQDLFATAARTWCRKAQEGSRITTSTKGCRTVPMVLAETDPKTWYHICSRNLKSYTNMMLPKSEIAGDKTGFLHWQSAWFFSTMF